MNSSVFSRSKNKEWLGKSFLLLKYFCCLYLERLYINIGTAHIWESVSQTSFTIDFSNIFKFNEKNNSVAWILSLKRFKSLFPGTLKALFPKHKKSYFQNLKRSRFSQRQTQDMESAFHNVGACTLLCTRSTRNVVKQLPGPGTASPSICTVTLTTARPMPHPPGYGVRFLGAY